jgi:hypothetical protein
MALFLGIRIPLPIPHAVYRAMLGKSSSLAKQSRRAALRHALRHINRPHVEEPHSGVSKDGNARGHGQRNSASSP